MTDSSAPQVRPQVRPERGAGAGEGVRPSPTGGAPTEHPNSGAPLGASLLDQEPPATIVTSRCFEWCLGCSQTSDQPGWAVLHHDATGHQTFQRESSIRSWGGNP